MITFISLQEGLNDQYNHFNNIIGIQRNSPATHLFSIINHEKQIGINYNCAARCLSGICTTFRQVLNHRHLIDLASNNHIIQVRTSLLRPVRVMNQRLLARLFRIEIDRKFKENEVSRLAMAFDQAMCGYEQLKNISCSNEQCRNYILLIFILMFLKIYNKLYSLRTCRFGNFARSYISIFLIILHIYKLFIYIYFFIINITMRQDY